MNTEELTRLYQSIEIGDDSVQNVLDAMPSRAVGRGAAKYRLPRTQIFALTAALIVVLIAGLIYATLPSDNDRHAPTGHSSTPTAASPKPTVQLPAKRPDTLSGAVVSNGRPLPGAYVNVMLMPIGSIQDHLKKGQTVPTKNLPAIQTGPHGSFVVMLDKSDVANRRFREFDYINFEVDVVVGNRMTTWYGTFHFLDNTATPIRMIFDFGAHTIQVDGRKSKLSIF